MYDAIVVGARCAGAPTAMLLAREGHRVLLLDRAGFPSDILSTHYLHQPGVAQLQRWGLLQQVAATGCPPVTEQVFDVGPFALRGAPPPADGVTEGYAPRRTVLDQILVEAAVQAGVELREHFSVKELLTDGDRITGVRGSASGGATVTEHAPIVIGADGQHSLVAREVGAATYHATPALTCAYYTYWADVDVECVELCPRPDRMIIAAPTNDDKVLTIVYWPRAMFHEVRADIEGSYRQALAVVPDLAERIYAGERAEQFRGTADLHNFFRRAHGPGWALVGDAGCHKDPILARGITDAFVQADLLADAVHAGLSGGQPMQEALAGFERARDDYVMPLFDMSVDLAHLAPPPPEMQQLFGALADNPAQTDRFLGVAAGTVPVQEFFGPENMARIMAVEVPEPA